MNYLRLEYGFIRREMINKYKLRKVDHLGAHENQATQIIVKTEKEIKASTNLEFWSN